MMTLQGYTRTAFLCFFMSHIPITLIIDGQAFFPRHYYPKILQDIVDWYATTFKDKLMLHPPPNWFASLVAIEVLFQLPFFFVAVYVLLLMNTSTRLCGDGLFRSLCIIYGSSTATTLIPILSSILSDEDTTIGEKGILLGFYLPYLIFPIWLVSIAVCEQNVLGSETKKKE